jgi:hypothetical protein
VELVNGEASLVLTARDGRTGGLCNALADLSGNAFALRRRNINGRRRFLSEGRVPLLTLKVRVRSPPKPLLQVKPEKSKPPNELKSPISRSSQVKPDCCCSVHSLSVLSGAV